MGLVSIEKPLRAEILSQEGLVEYARTLADQHRVAFSKKKVVTLYSRFKENELLLQKAYHTLSEASQNKEPLTSGAEWLLDNYYIIKEQVLDICRDFPGGYYRTLPKLSEGEYKNYPRVYHIALEIIAHTDAALDDESLTLFIDAYQTRSALEIGELWAVPIMLRFALIENLRRLVLADLEIRERSQTAEDLLQEIIGSDTCSGTDILLMLASKLKENPDFLTPSAINLMRRLREKGPKSTLTLRWLEERLKEQGYDSEEMTRVEHHAQAANQISIGNSVTALRKIKTIDWKNWFEQVSLVHKALLLDPAGMYPRCDFLTRDNYRHTIEQLARTLKLPELDIAHHVVKLAEQAKIKDIGDKAQESSNVEVRISHIGYYLISKGLEELKNQLNYSTPRLRYLCNTLHSQAFVLYISSIIILTFAMIFELIDYTFMVGGSLGESILIAIILAIPLSDLACSMVQWVETHRVRPKLLPKLDFDSGVPDEYRTIVALQAIFHTHDAVTQAIEGLEVRYLANDDPNILFALLADHGDANEESIPTDQEIILHASTLVSQLNERHFPGTEGRFFLLFRKRLWNPSENKYMGWERKRGKVSEFNRLILGEEHTSLRVYGGDPKRLNSVTYVLTLDSDSRLPRGVAKKLIGTMAHPLNRPIFHPQNNTIVDGYGIVQPRVGVDYSSAYASRFADIFSGHAGLDPYTQMVSDIYQDLFGEGSYVGKGIYDVRAFERALHNRVPENALLSHDLFEGCFVRVALATDIEIFDNFPSHYYSYAKRLHRWVRGDWQLLPWIFARIPDASYHYYRSPLSLLCRWKLVDNLRRSLVAPLCFIFLVLAFTILPGSPLLWIPLVVLVISFPVYARVANALILPPLDISVGGYARVVGRDLLRQSFQAFISICFLPYQAYVMIDAVVVTLYRLSISKKRLLEWESAAITEKRSSRDLLSIFRQVGPGLGLAILVALLVAIVAPERELYAAPFLLLWTFSPFLIRWLSGLPTATTSTISEYDRESLYSIGWETWRYFDQFMTEEHNFLPPDNIQLVPRSIVAERTSPTNISLSILSVISAYDCGFIALPSVIDRLKNTYKTLTKLERFHGHFLNWYQTKTLLPLNPRYISFVDSGNLVGHLIAARTAFAQFLQSPLVTTRHWQHLCRRIASLLRQKPLLNENIESHLRTLLSELASPPVTINKLLLTLDSIQSFIDFLETEVITTEVLSSKKISQLGSLAEELRQILSIKPMLDWYPLLESNLATIQSSVTTHRTNPSDLRNKIDHVLKLSREGIPTLLQLRAIYESIEILIAATGSIHSPLHEKVYQSKLATERLIIGINNLKDQTDTFINETDLAFLYDPVKGLFSIGYHIDNGQKDNSFYDLLASESRLGSFVAIALGQVPQKHWFALGRSLIDSPGGAALVSWSATMFEYLMPLLVMHKFPGTLLSKTYGAVVRAQQLYALQRAIPWGISESAYSGVDFEKTYQYKAFGIPALGLKRGLADDVVVSPYSTFLALMVDPAASMQNLQILEKQGMRGEFGFYESIDFTAERLSKEEDSHIVQSFLSHHQAMSLIALNNTLHEGVIQERFHADPWVQATTLLLQERFPDPIPMIVSKEGENLHQESHKEELSVSKSDHFETPHTRYPRTHLLSNGHYTVMVDNAGNGFSIFDKDTALTRWREDATAGQYGTYIFVRDLDDGKLWSVAYQPTCIEPESYEVLFNPDKIEFKRRDFGIFLHTEITVSPEDNVELRKVSITNLSDRTRNLELVSYAEVALAHNRADLVHPVFSKMFIESEYNQDFEGLIFSRRPRSKGEERLYLLHMLTMKTAWGPTQYESSRSGFLGRGNLISTPAFFNAPTKRAGTTGKILDPVFALRARVELAEGKTEIVVFSTCFAKSKEEVLLLGQRYHDLHSITRAFEMAWSNSTIELRHAQFSISQIYTFQHLATALFYNVGSFRGSEEVLLRNKLTQSGLWRFGVSGDLPIVVLRIDDPAHLKLIQELLLAHQYIRMRGVGFDLVIINEYPGGYFQAFQEELEFMVRAGSSAGLVDKKGGIYLRTKAQISSEEIELLEAIARVVLWGTKGPLSTQLQFDDKAKEVPPRKKAFLSSLLSINYPEITLPQPQFEFYNGSGGFTDRGENYQIEVQNYALPPLPWSNVIANPHF